MTINPQQITSQVLSTSRNQQHWSLPQISTLPINEHVGSKVDVTKVVVPKVVVLHFFGSNVVGLNVVGSKVI